MAPIVQANVTELAGSPAKAESERTTAMRNFPVLQAIVTIGAVQVATMFFNLVRSKIVALTAGPEGLGAIGVIDQVVAMVAQISTFSLPYASAKFLSAAHSESREAFAKQYVAFLRALLVISLAGTAIGTVLVFVRPAVLGSELVGYGGIVLIALLAIPANNLTGLLTNAMAAARRVRASALLGLFTAIALAIGSGGGLLVAGLSGYYAGSVFMTLVVLAGGMVYLFKKEQLHGHYGAVSVLTEIRRYPQVLSFAASLYIISFTTPLAEFIARYSLLRKGGFAATGLLQSALGLALALRTVMRASNALLLTPAMNRIGDSTEKLRGAVEFARALSLTIGIIAVPIVLFPDWLLFVLYSHRFLAAAPYVYLFVLAECLQLLAGVNQALIIGLNHIATNVLVSIVADIGIAAISWWLAPQYGIAGVAIAFLVSRPLIFMLTALKLRSSHGMAISRAMGWLPLYVLGVIATAGALVSWFNSNTAAIIILKLAVWAAFTFSLLRMVRTNNGNLLQSLRRSLYRAN